MSGELAAADAFPASPTGPVGGDGAFSDSPAAGSGGGAGEVQHSDPADPTGTSTLPRPSAVEQAGETLKDKTFLLLFLAHLVLVVMVGAVANGSSPGVSNRWLLGSGAFHFTRMALIGTGVVGSLLGLVVFYVLQAPRLQPLILKYCQPPAGVLLTILALELLVSGKVFLGICLAVLVVMDLLVFLKIKDRLQFVQVLLEVATTAMQEHPRIRVVVCVAVAVQCVFFALWSLLAAQVLYVGRGRFSDAAFLSVLLFSLRWTTTVIKGVVRVTVAGTVTSSLVSGAGSSGAAVVPTGHEDIVPLTTPHVGSGGMADESDGEGGAGAGDGVPLAPRSSRPRANRTAAEPDPLVSMYLKRGLTTSLGSLCAGAVVGVVTPVLWGVLRVLRKLETGACGSVAAPLARGFQAVLILSHKYGYPDVAVDSKPWFQAARETWKAFNDRGLEAVVADDCSDRVLLFLCYSVAALQASVVFIFMPATVLSWTFVLLVVFWFAFASTSLAVTAVESVVTALFVSFANRPESLSQRHPIIYHRLCRISEVRNFQRNHGSAIV